MSLALLPTEALPVRAQFGWLLSSAILLTPLSVASHPDYVKVGEAQSALCLPLAS